MGAVKQLIWEDYGRGKKLLIRNENIRVWSAVRRVVSVEVTSVDGMFIRIVIDFLCVFSSTRDFDRKIQYLTGIKWHFDERTLFSGMAAIS